MCTGEGRVMYLVLVCEEGGGEEVLIRLLFGDIGRGGRGESVPTVE